MNRCKCGRRGGGRVCKCRQATASFLVWCVCTSVCVCVSVWFCFKGTSLSPMQSVGFIDESLLRISREGKKVAVVLGQVDLTGRDWGRAERNKMGRTL